MNIEFWPTWKMQSSMTVWAVQHCSQFSVKLLDTLYNPKPPPYLISLSITNLCLPYRRLDNRHHPNLWHLASLILQLTCFRMKSTQKCREIYPLSTTPQPSRPLPYARHMPTWTLLSTFNVIVPPKYIPWSSVVRRKYDIIYNPAQSLFTPLKLYPAL